MKSGNGGIQVRHGTLNSDRIKVLMYHRIVESESLSHSYPDLCTHVSEFRSHLTWLEKWGFTPITFEDYHLCKTGELWLPKKPVILTFDDGYVDTFNNAFPLLREFGMKAVLFVMGNRLLRTNAWDQPAGLPLAELISDQQILELHTAGFEIGSHSMNHVRLSDIPRDQAWEEISRSRMVLEILLNAPVRSFAFPYGQVDEATKRMVYDAGYAVGCATYSGPPAFCTDPFEIRRLIVPGFTNMFQFGITMLTPYEYYRWLVWKVKTFMMDGKAARHPIHDRTVAQAKSAVSPMEEL
jgi:peptidoglycan/xylan/chitin deacetylase (PgdA/CDA1 family)